MAAVPPPPPVTGVNVVKGEGLVAQQRFEKGALILTEDPLVMCDTGKKYSTWDKEAVLSTKNSSNTARQCCGKHSISSDFSTKEPSTPSTLPNARRQS